MKIASKAYTALIFLFLYAPIVVLVVFSFNASSTRTMWGGFSLRWYEKLFEDQMLLMALRNTLIIAVVSAAAATALGTLAAIGINAYRGIARKAIMNVTKFPMVNPEIVTGVSMMLLFVFATRLLGGSSLGMVSLIIAHTTFCLPYVVLSIMPKLHQMDPHLYEAAQDLSCPPVRAFSR